MDLVRGTAKVSTFSAASSLNISKPPLRFRGASTGLIFLFGFDMALFELKGRDIGGLKVVSDAIAG